MLVKIVFVFLLAMVIVAMFGKALFPGAMSRLSPLRRKSTACARCGRPQIGKAPCECRARR